MKQLRLFTAIFLAALGIDQALKAYVSGLKQPSTFGFIELFPVPNPGIIFGAFIDVPALVRVLLLSTLFFFIAFFVVFLLFMLRRKDILSLKIGMVLLTAGFFGNVLDRIRIGYALDYVLAHLFGYAVYFNFADAVQWAGATLILVAVFRHREALWSEKNQRNRVLIDRRFQLTVASIFAACTLFTTLAIGLISYAYIATTLRKFPWIENSPILHSYLWTFVVISILFTAIMFLVGIQLTFYSAGPLYAFRRHIELLLEGKPSKPLKLRTGDFHPELEELSRRLLEFRGKP